MEQLTDFEIDKRKMLNMYFNRNMTIRAIAKELKIYSEKTITRDILDFLDMQIDKYRANKKFKAKLEKLKSEQPENSNLAFIDRLDYTWADRDICVGDVKIVKGEMLPRINKLIVR